jgi:UPF0042 nucleotide-binding protein
MTEARTLIITGMSGAGKTQVMRTLEDLGYFCVDNLPPTFIPKFMEICMQSQTKDPIGLKLALVVDIRGGKFFNELAGVLDKLENNSVKYELLFLDASDATLIKRYKETRRRHPLGTRGGLSASIDKERKILSTVRDKASLIIDTSDMTNDQLRKKIIAAYGKDGGLPPMNIVIQSFGFKHGVPMDCDMLLDVRFLPNPFYVPELKQLCGNDKPVVDFISKKPVTKEFTKKLEDMTSFLLPLYVKEGKSQLMVGVGCTGGRHRSVYIANLLGSWIKKAGYNVQVVHRDLLKK